MRRLTDDIVLSVKDQLRNIRYSIRNEADPAARGATRPFITSPTDALSLFGNPVARLADGVLTQMENVTLTLLSADREARGDIRFPCPVESYFVTGAGARPFTATHYHLVKDVLQRAGAVNMLVFEHAIEQAQDALLARHGDLIFSADAKPDADPARRRWALARICAAVTLELVAARPVQKVDFGTAQAAGAKHVILSPNLYGFLVLGLATAVASLNPIEGVEAEEIIDSACAVVDARFGRFNAAVQAKDPVDALARAFLGVVAFLP